MSEVMDLKKSVIDLKADEQMIAFAGFALRAPDQGQGVLKISAFYRKDGSGYLTLTFVVDTRAEASARGALQKLFGALTEDALRVPLEAELEMMVSAPLGALSQIPDWYLEECSLYFRKLQGREKWLLDQLLIPALGSVLGLSFGTIEWWLDDADADPNAPKQAALKGGGGFAKSVFQRWFGGE